MTLAERVFARARQTIRDRVRKDIPIDVTPVFNRGVAQTPQIQDRVYTDEIIRLREEEEQIDAGFTDGWEAGQRQRKPGTKRKDPVDLYQ